MKITDVQVIVLESPGSYEAPKGSEEAYGIKYLGIVKVTTDAGLTVYADGPPAATLRRFTLEHFTQESSLGS